MRNTILRLDPWPAEYESSFQIDEFEEEGAQVDADVEGVAWQAIGPTRQERPKTLYFVDGVRRVEARIVVELSAGCLVLLRWARCVSKTTWPPLSRFE